ncbi:MAG: imidazole glycerol phosphate synthase subunit HisH [Candidatus Rokuibacteriota bacterium]|nr:MAG: imidazole glycerol phosphate synthase subunit HisH [Candidatus Rokubacteria bacterium]
MIAVIDYGRGNLGSVEKAFRRVGCPAVVTQDPRAVDDAQAVVLPGDGAFHDAMRNLDALDLLPALRRALDGTRPFLGICLGYQLLFSTSEEFGEGRGLDVVPGAVRRLPPGPKIPHMGWNRVEHAGDLKLFDGIPPAARFYFVHSFYPVVAGTVSTDRTEGGLTQMRVAPDAQSGLTQMRVAPEARSDHPEMRVAPEVRPLRIAWCQYGIRFAAAIEVGRIYATQFHPEKSQRWGLRMLENFAAIVKDGA